jgi:hypothetical protein
MATNGKFCLLIGNQKQELPMAAICSSSWHSSFREEVGVIKIRKLKDRQHNSQRMIFFL